MISIRWRHCASFIFLCSLLLWGQALWAQQLIKGGEGVGSIRLGSSLAQVQQILGRPDKALPSPNDPQAKLLHFKSQGLAVFMGSNGRVIGVTVLSGSWKTPEGIGLGSAATSVTQTYGQGLQRGQGNINYATKGLAFSLRQGKVTGIYVFKREDDRPLLGDRLIIPGQRVGQIKIGMPASTVSQAWGQADSVTPMGQGGRSLYRYREEALGLIVSNSGRIEGLVMETGDFITQQGVKVGSSQAEVVRAFGQAPMSGGSLIYEKKGIGFRFTQGRVSQITVLPKV